MSKRRKLTAPLTALDPEAAGSLDEPARIQGTRPASFPRAKDVKEGLPDPSGGVVPFLTGIAQLMAVDDAIYGPGGILSRIIMREDRAEVIRKAREQAGTGAELRQALLDIGAREFGMKPFDLDKAVPRMLSPMMAPGLSDSFYLDDVGARLRTGHALVLTDPTSLSLVELLASRGSGSGNGLGGPSILVGVVPWTYALLTAKTPTLCKALCFTETSPNGSKGIAFEPFLDHKEPFVRTLALPEEPGEADKMLRWLLLEVVHQRLLVPSDSLPVRGRRGGRSDGWLGPVPDHPLSAGSGR